MKFPVRTFFTFNVVLIIAIGIFGGFAVHISTENNYETNTHSLAHWVLAGPDTVHIEKLVGDEPFGRYVFSYNDGDAREDLFFADGVDASRIASIRQTLEKDGYEAQPADSDGQVAYRRKGGDFIYFVEESPAHLHIKARPRLN